jgi:spore coat polysaccharide biosynthesis protein SpsF (cytidylyltransferase family)
MIVAIIQARLGSTRLPGKVLKQLKDKTILEHIISRVRRSQYIEKIIVATTVNPKDDKLVEFVSNIPNTEICRGSEDNVLERFCLCAKEFQADIIVRVTADDPLKDPSIIDEAISYILDNSDLDYCSNTIKPTYPEGLDIEVFRFEALEKAYNEASLLSEKEHVTPYIWKNKDIFNVKNFEYSEDLSSWRWTLDKPEDFEFISRIYDEFYDDNPNFSYTTVIDFLKKNFHIQEINIETIRNEGYLKSIENER